MAELADVMSDNKIVSENMEPTKKDAFGIMVALRDKDEVLDGTDITILSHVLSDPDSKFFITVDSDILDSEVIGNIAKDLKSKGKRRSKLKIIDRF